MEDFKQVTQEECKEFVKKYPNKLEWHVSGICEPPIGSHNDFSDGKVWPESMVTNVYLYDGSDRYDFRTKEYYIKSSVINQVSEY